MPSQPPPWKVYRQALAPLTFGHALWEPGPIYSYRRVRPGDVGYTRRGRFHLLFSAGIPLGSRSLGIDVPLTFEPLDVGPIIPGEVRPPGYLRTDTVRDVGADVGGSVAVACPVEPGARIAFALTHKQGAALITKYPTHREDIERERLFESYIKRHYDSWVDFAHEHGHGGNIRPVLVTGVDLTREFATIAYSDNHTRMECEFSAGVPAVASASMSLWGSWRTQGLVHTNCGPRPSSTRRNRGPIEGPALESEIPDEYNQCVFIRYYTIRKRVFIPIVIKAGAGPHQLPEGGHGNDSTGGDMLSAPLKADSMEVDYLETESLTGTSDEVIHNVPPVGLDRYRQSQLLLLNRTKDDHDDFDILAEFIFQRSSAGSVLLHHRDIQNLPQGDEEESTRLLDESGVVQRVEIDETGVGQLARTSSTGFTQPVRPDSDIPEAPIHVEGHCVDGGHLPNPLNSSDNEQRVCEPPNHGPSIDQFSLDLVNPPVMDGSLDQTFDHDSSPPSGSLPDQESDSRSRTTSDSSHSHRHHQLPLPGSKLLKLESPYRGTAYPSTDTPRSPSQISRSPPFLDTAENLHTMVSLINQSVCDYCHQRPKIPPYNYCGKRCKFGTKAASVESQTVMIVFMCKQCNVKPKYMNHEFCGRECAIAWTDERGQPLTGSLARLPSSNHNQPMTLASVQPQNQNTIRVGGQPQDQQTQGGSQTQNQHPGQGGNQSGPERGGVKRLVKGLAKGFKNLFSNSPSQPPPPQQQTVANPVQTQQPPINSNLTFNPGAHTIPLVLRIPSGTLSQSNNSGGLWGQNDQPKLGLFNGVYPIGPPSKLGPFNGAYPLQPISPTKQLPAGVSHQSSDHPSQTTAGLSNRNAKPRLGPFNGAYPVAPPSPTDRDPKHKLGPFNGVYPLISPRKQLSVGMSQKSTNLPPMTTAGPLNQNAKPRIGPFNGAYLIPPPPPTDQDPNPELGPFNGAYPISVESPVLQTPDTTPDKKPEDVWEELGHSSQSTDSLSYCSGDEDTGAFPDQDAGKGGNGRGGVVVEDTDSESISLSIYPPSTVVSEQVGICRMKWCSNPTFIDPITDLESEYCSWKHQKEATAPEEEAPCAMCHKTPRGANGHFSSKKRQENALSP